MTWKTFFLELGTYAYLTHEEESQNIFVFYRKNITMSPFVVSEQVLQTKLKKVYDMWKNKLTLLAQCIPTDSPDEEEYMNTVKTLYYPDILFSETAANISISTSTGRKYIDDFSISFDSTAPVQGTEKDQELKKYGVYIHTTHTRHLHHRIRLQAIKSVVQLRSAGGNGGNEGNSSDAEAEADKLSLNSDVWYKGDFHDWIGLLHTLLKQSDSNNMFSLQILVQSAIETLGSDIVFQVLYVLILGLDRYFDSALRMKIYYQRAKILMNIIFFTKNAYVGVPDKQLIQEYLWIDFPLSTIDSEKEENESMG
jgi:hypothetical protein